MKEEEKEYKNCAHEQKSLVVADLLALLSYSTPTPVCDLAADSIARKPPSRNPDNMGEEETMLSRVKIQKLNSYAIPGVGEFTSRRAAKDFLRALETRTGSCSPQWMSDHEYARARDRVLAFASAN